MESAESKPHLEAGANIEISPHLEASATAKFSICGDCIWPADCMRQACEGLRDLLRFSGCCGGKDDKKKAGTNGREEEVRQEERITNSEQDASPLGDTQRRLDEPNPVGNMAHPPSSSSSVPNTVCLVFFPAGSDSPTKLEIGNYDEPHMWAEITLPDEGRFKRAAQMKREFNFRIAAKIHLANLSHGTYAAYLIFKIASGSEGLINRKQTATVSTSYEDDKNQSVCVEQAPNRPDGWKELELGQFVKKDGLPVANVVVSLEDSNISYRKKGLIVACIEVRRL